MKIALIGATGYVGSAILKEALDRGHDVTAIARHPEKLQAHAKLRPAKGDVSHADEVARLVAGHDAVISAFNPRWSNPDIYNQQGCSFSEPMKLPNGKTLAPTGRKVKLPMATIARWKNGCIAEEHLFWDNAEYMKQLGLGT